MNRKENGIRDYKEIDLKLIELIKCMRIAGLPIEVLIKYFDLIEQGDQTIDSRRKILADKSELLAAKI